MLEELTVRYGLSRLAPFAKWGLWQRHHPEVACGIKRGFSFFHRSGQRFFVEASPRDEIADTHWYRADFDAFFVQEAQLLGVEYVDHVLLDRVELAEDRVRLTGKGLSVSARFVVDASGPRGFLHRALGLKEAEFPGFPRTQAVYNHFTHVGRLADSAGNGFPVNDAAVHHVFDGGWIWVLQFNNGVTSAGAVSTTPPEWKRLVRETPDLNAQFSGARPLYEFKHLPRVPFRSSQICGHRWALLPSAAGFVDPLLSTGFPLTLLGIERLARAIETGSMRGYAENTDSDLLRAAELIGALYANMDRFDLFSRISLLYFASVSYAETAHRLGKKHLAQSYLLREDPVFGPEIRKLLRRAATGQGRETLGEDILKAIEPIDVAGLRRNADTGWFPVDADDLLCSASKLDASREEISAMLARSGFYAAEARPACATPQRYR
jgi:FADH2 O2-dependent halogenase